MVEKRISYVCFGVWGGSLYKYIWVPHKEWTNYTALQRTSFIHSFLHKTFSYHCSFLLNSLGWQWLTKLYTFRMHNSTPHHLYTILYVHHLKYPSITIYSPVPSSTSLHPPHLHPSNHHTVVQVREFFLVFFLFCSIPPTSIPNPTAFSLLSYLWICHYFAS